MILKEIMLHMDCSKKKIRKTVYVRGMVSNSKSATE
jgi:hypothetical protein